MGAADQFPVAVLGRQVPLDFLHRGRELHIVVGRGHDLQGSGALVGRHVVDVPRDVRRRTTIANAATGPEFSALVEVALAIWPRQQLDDGLLGTH